MRRWLILPVLALPAALAGCASGNNIPYVTAATPGAESPPIAHPAAVVVIEGQADVPSFGPATVTIPAGGTVKWIWQDPGIACNVTFPTFHSATKTAGTFYRRFDVPGAYSYQCTLQATSGGIIDGTVLVK